jgi:SH3-like domain-containing protein
MKRGVIAAVVVALAVPAAAQDKQPPYWASIASGEAMMRTGPGRNYPGIWLYKRRDLPIRVVKTYPNWRMIEDPDGTRGWMLVSLLSDRRTAIVKPGEPRPIHIAPSEASLVRYRAEHGVVGRIENCRDGWCRIAIGKREGFIRMSDIWGVGDGEVVD